MTVPHYLYYCSFVLGCEFGGMNPPILFFLKIFLAILHLLHFLVSFWVSFPFYGKKQPIFWYTLSWTCRPIWEELSSSRWVLHSTNVGCVSIYLGLLYFFLTVFYAFTVCFKFFISKYFILFADIINGIILISFLDFSFYIY